jgi:hypothetical protein
MSNYVQSTNFATKDSLPSGDPLKIVKGTEINTEFANIAIAVATKADTASPTLTSATLVSPTLTSPTMVAPVLGTPVSGNFSSGTFTWPTFNQNTTGSAATATSATSATKLVTINFTIEESGGKLIFKYGGTTIASMTSAGVFTALSDVAGGGTP